jgi:hypothetical protein
MPEGIAAIAGEAVRPCIIMVRESCENAALNFIF